MRAPAVSTTDSSGTKAYCVASSETNGHRPDALRKAGGEDFIGAADALSMSTWRTGLARGGPMTRSWRWMHDCTLVVIADGNLAD
jgi:hypothetical protein